MLINDSEILKMNKILHEDKNFGTSGYRWVDSVKWICNRNQVNNILDYGAGKQTLADQLTQSGFVGNIYSYDPAVAELSSPPKPADLVVCTDVLEHIEINDINLILEHICNLTKRYIFIHVPKGPAGKFLPDGRNAHLIQKNLDWWLPLLMNYFDLISLNNLTHGISFYGAIKSNSEDPIIKLINNFDLSEIVYFNFDGMCAHIGLKSNKKSKRVIPKIFGLFNKPSRSGIAKYNQKYQDYIGLNITYF
jgi:uncharacterized protein YijF (DUF1287 family)